MTPVSLLTRRILVGTALAGLALPGLAAAQTSATEGQATMDARLRCRFADQDFTYRLLDNATTRDLLSMLPLELTIEDFSTNEKIAPLPQRLDEGEHVAFSNEVPGDLCYVLGWGNLAFLRADYHYRGDLIRLGRIEGGVGPLLTRGEFPLRLERIG